MKSTRLALVFLLPSLLWPARGALAWGPTGHRVVAEIAQQHLTKTARERIEKLLHGYTLADVANWPDELRSEKRYDKYKRLHFATVPDGVASYRDSKKDPCGDLVTAIRALSAYLKTGKREELLAVKALSDQPDGTGRNACNPEATEPITPETALRFLVHFMGDLHQPLHVGGTDLGGNKVNVNWMNRWRTNLHSTWDDEMVDYEKLYYMEYARFLDHAKEAEVAQWQSGDLVAWADENVAMRPLLYSYPDEKSPAPAASVVYAEEPDAPPPAPPLISYNYVGAHRTRLRQQLLKGGIRLAGVLNSIFR